ncbi:MAG: hypothetical protein IH602_18700 [Bryobacteraceae bacterium]|nr:hypothetical protein [Bryobacteraceae bacterium]
MRRASLAGPLILIGIGSFFLMRKWVDIPPLWRLVSDWWPLILVAIGVWQLVDRTAGRGRS